MARVSRRSFLKALGMGIGVATINPFSLIPKPTSVSGISPKATGRLLKKLLRRGNKALVAERFGATTPGWPHYISDSGISFRMTGITQLPKSLKFRRYNK